MQTLDRDQVSVHIDAPADILYDIVADVTRMSDLSPEIVQCAWLDGVSSAAPGVRFKATNKIGRRPSWNNWPVFTSANRGREIAWSRTEPFAGTVLWHYRFELDGSGTRVTESYEVTRPISRLGWFIIERLFGGTDRRSDLRAGMERTLERLRIVAEEKPHVRARQQTHSVPLIR